MLFPNPLAPDVDTPGYHNDNRSYEQERQGPTVCSCRHHS
ncbi:putative phage-related protein [Stenotrophomonas maltophilia K279a]|uniref:Phage-related protein n=1 Tax=Stenotrophomonas maltophilia (strain K279a) TaxID=522373 RepID=B2FMM8_STRMK|nr:putative phage-related protein [Stenotrophomonas maltophilia K279a]